jgi:hypothetical protein
MDLHIPIYDGFAGFRRMTVSQDDATPTDAATATRMGYGYPSLKRRPGYGRAFPDPYFYLIGQQPYRTKRHEKLALI